MIYRRMRESLTAVQAGVFVSILFGVGHGNLPQGLYAMVLGLLLACIYEKFRNIAAPILFHIVVNITSLLLSWYGGFEWDSGNRGKSSWNYCAGYVDYCYNLCKNKKYKTRNTIIN